MATSWSRGAVPGIADTAYFTNPVNMTYVMSGGDLVWAGMVGLGTGRFHNLTHTFAPASQRIITITGDVHVGRVAGRGAKFAISQGSIFITNSQQNATLYLGLADQSALGSFTVNNGTMVVDRVVTLTNGPNHTMPFQGSSNTTAYVHIRNGGYLISGNIYLSDWLLSGGTLTRVPGDAGDYVELLLYGRLVVTGPSTLFRNRVRVASVRPAPDFHNALLVVTNGATLWLDRAGGGYTLAVGRNTSNAYVVVTHNGVLTTGVDIAIGGVFESDARNTLNARMLVTENGKVFNNIGDVGAIIGDSRRNAIIVGTRARVNNGGLWENNVLRVGAIDCSGVIGELVNTNNALLVESGGLVRATTAMIGFVATYIPGGFVTNNNNRIIVDGGTLLVTNGRRTATLLTYRGPLVLKAGLAEVDRFEALTQPSGTVLFEGGTLKVNAATTNNNGAAFSVANGTLFLAGGNHNYVNSLNIGANGVLKGTGRVIGTVTNSGMIAPGDSIGTLPIAGNVTMAHGAVYHWELDTLSNDVLAVSGNLIFQGEATLVVTNLEPMYVPAGSTSTLFTVAGTYRGPTSWNYVLPTGWSVAFISELTPGTVSISLIPEPASLLLCAAMLCLLPRAARA